MFELVRTGQNRSELIVAERPTAPSGPSVISSPRMWVIPAGITHIIMGPEKQVSPSLFAARSGVSFPALGGSPWQRMNFFMKTLKFRRALTVLAVLVPLFPLIVATAAPAQAQSGSRICARWGTKDKKTVYRAIELTKGNDIKDKYCFTRPMSNLLKQGLTDPLPVGDKPWWGKCEHFRDMILQLPRMADPCLSMPRNKPLDDHQENYVREFSRP